MLRYINFLTFTFAKKWGGYIIVVLAIAMSALFNILSIRSQNDMGLTPLNGLTTFVKFFPFLFAILFSAMVIVHVFKEGEIDGTELVIVAKPITRPTLIASKFIVIIASIIAYQTIIMCANFAIVAMDKIATMGQKNNYVMSLYVGGIIVQLISTSIIALLALVFGKVGTIVVSILFSALVPIVSFTLVPLGKGWGAAIPKDAYELKMPITADEEINGVDSAEEIYVVKNESSVTSGWYGGASYLDIWYQWGRFYSIFAPDQKNEMTTVQKWSVDKNTKLSTNVPGLQVGNQKYVFMMSGEQNLSKMIEVRRTANLVVSKLTEALKNDQTLKSNFEAAELLSRIQYIENIDNQNNQITPANSLTYNSDTKYNFAKAVLVEQLLEKNRVITAANTMGNIDKSLSDNKVIIAADQDVIVALKNSDFINTKVVVGIWVSIGVILVGATVWIYSKRDFK